jgi:adenosine 3'-phospho 5'-phosphosulfate transporter B3
MTLHRRPSLGSLEAGDSEESEKRFTKSSSARLHAAALVLVVLVLHTAVTVFEEHVFTIPGFHHGLWLSASSQAIMALLVALSLLAKLRYGGESPLLYARVEASRLASSTATRTGLSCVFASYTVSTALSKISLGYVSVPLQVVVKSSKLIPVMIGGRFITGRRFSGREYLSATSLVLGVALFSWGEHGGGPSRVSNSSNVSTGLALLVVTLCADAILGNWQERTMKEAALSAAGMQLLQSTFAGAVSCLAAVCTGELREGAALLRLHPVLGRIVFCYAIAMVGGTIAILKLVERWGAPAAVVVTLLRKCSSMAFSYVLFPKPLGWKQVAGSALVFAAPFLVGRS